MVTHFKKLSLPKKSKVYSTYWKFAEKRNEVFLNRLRDPLGPWTDDPVIRQNRFTNVFRATDRVSQYLIRLQYSGAPPEDVFFKTLLFKIFNKIETYSYLQKELKDISYSNFSIKRYDELLTMRMAENKPIYSAAYIMPSAGNVFGYKYKHTNHLALLKKIIDDNTYLRVVQSKSLADVYKIMLSYPSFGSFLAFQYTIDINYSSLTNFSEMDFVVAGPGAKNGILKCFDTLGDYTLEDVIKWITDNQEKECADYEIHLPKLWGRNLHLIDCQNIFCEVDKYLRVTNPSLNERSGKTRIKQKFTTAKGAISYFFPPKWNINDKQPLCQLKTNASIFS
ncbi:nucleotide kinase domain-containing protein [Ohtaekwangia kribbensis]|uniref:Nucleotide kinase domain-containing protein n=1 Tax=Ohtaekwangia kribbensis TaxID=688913 RepID=A0ABW3K3J6_9BACT